MPEERVVKVSIVASESELTQLREEMDEQSAAFETAPAGLVVAWAVDRFGSKLAMACSFQEAVLIDIAVTVDPAIEVVFLDTGSHFPETLEYVETIRPRYDLNLTVTQPVAGAEQWPCGTAQCCEFRKVRPLKQAMAGKDGLDHRPQAGGRPDPPGGPDRRLRRELGHGQDQPAGHVDRAGHRRLRRRPRHSPAPPACPRATSRSAVPRPPAR